MVSMKGFGWFSIICSAHLSLNNPIPCVWRVNIGHETRLHIIMWLTSASIFKVWNSNYDDFKMGLCYPRKVLDGSSSCVPLAWASAIPHHLPGGSTLVILGYIESHGAPQQVHVQVDSRLEIANISTSGYAYGTYERFWIIQHHMFLLLEPQLSHSIWLGCPNWPWDEAT